MSAPALTKTASTLRGITAALASTVRQTSRLRLGVIVTGVAALLAVALWVPVPSAVQLRDWAAGAGSWLALVFVVIHVVTTVAPIPRTAFTLAAGLLFGPVLGVTLAVVASTGSAVIAMLLVRLTGWRLGRLVRHDAIGIVEDRLRARGWLAILSLRLIPVVPFSAINYAAGASTVRLLPYTVATAIGLLPGTAAIVILGNAIAGDGSPLLMLVGVITGALGVTGLVVEIRTFRRHHRAARGVARPTPADTSV